MFSDAQQVFMLFYAVLYGTTLSSMNGFFPFPWGRIFENNKARNRLILSITFLNFCPIIYFFLVFYLLKEKTFCLNSFDQIIFSFLVILSALGIFAFYRIYHIIFCLDRNINLFWSNNYCRNDNCCSIGKDCWMQIKRKRDIYCDYFGHLFAVITYLIPSFILFIFINKPEIYNIVFLSVFISLGSVFLFLILYFIFFYF